MSNTRTARPAARPAAKPKAAPAPPEAPAWLEVFGGKYRVATEVGIWPLMQFARAAETGTSLTDHRGLAACHAFLQDVIDPADWGRFQDDMIAKKVNDLDALLNAARQAVDELVRRREARNARAAVNGKADGKAARAETGGQDAGQDAGQGEEDEGEDEEGREEEDTARSRIRASDRDRDQVIEQLAAALADGRITSGEHGERLTQAAAARTLGDLQDLTGDLPAAAGETP